MTMGDWGGHLSNSLAKLTLLIMRPISAQVRGQNE